MTAKTQFGPSDCHPYLAEIHDTAEDALARFEELERSATRWLGAHDRQLPVEHGELLQHAVEVSRISYLVDPFSSKPYTRARGVYPLLARDRRDGSDPEHGVAQRLGALR
jgi:hypothetical protein